MFPQKEFDFEFILASSEDVSRLRKDYAKQNPILELIWLQVYSKNTLGLSLYKKMGFQENGIIKNYFKYERNFWC